MQFKWLFNCNVNVSKYFNQRDKKALKLAQNPY